MIITVEIRNGKNENWGIRRGRSIESYWRGNRGSEDCGKKE